MARKEGERKLKQNAIPTLFNTPNPPRKFDLTPMKSIYKVLTVLLQSTYISSKKFLYDLYFYIFPTCIEKSRYNQNV